MDILALLHVSSIDNIENILKSKELYTQQKFRYSKIKDKGLPTDEYKHIFNPIGDQYPGVYFSVIDTNFKPVIYSEEDIFLIFCKDLLKRGDFHYNYIDANGFMNEGNTLFGENELTEGLKIIKTYL